MFENMLKLSMENKRIVMPVADFLFLPTALWVAYSMRLGEWYRPIDEQWWLFVAAPVVAFPVFAHMGLYRAAVRYMESKALWKIVQAVSISVLLWATVVMLSGISGTPRSVILIYWFTATAAVGGSRMVIRWMMVRLREARVNQKNVLIYGAGDAGIQLAVALSHAKGLTPIGFIDDAPQKINTELRGLRVYQPTELESLIQTKRAQEVLIAIPSASVLQRRHIIRQLERFSVTVRIVPSVIELAQGKVQLEDLRQIDIGDLLGRDAVPPKPMLLAACIRGKSVMVTGAGGSIGSELCRQIINLAPKRLVLFERTELALYQVKKEMLGMLTKGESVTSSLPMGQPKDIEIVDVLGSVLHQKHLEKICRTLGVQTIYHTAAYKHVPMMEFHPVEAVYNNVLGTLRMALAAETTGVETFVFVSTDKAVRPTNVMGATKRFAELILQALSAEQSLKIVEETRQRSAAKTKFSMVRFGNVLNSSGSVVPLFREQIKNGGPVTVTNEKVLRYFMTMPEAAQLVIQAGSMAKGGDVFVLDMGEPVKIMDLAKRMIRLAGKRFRAENSAGSGIEIKIVGLRPGEKLYEELLIGDNVSSTPHPKIMRAEEDMLPWNLLKELLKELEKACENDELDNVKKALKKAVVNYTPQSNEVKRAVL